MKTKLSFLAAIALGFASAVSGQVTIDDFNTGTTTGQVVAGTNWVGQVATTGTSIVVTGGENNGWGATGVSLNATGMNFIAVTAQVDSGNLASSFVVRFSDDFLETEVFSTPIASSFTSTMSTYYIPISWTTAIDITNITSWSIGGGGVTSTAFRMTIDNVALTPSGAPVPEPSTYAAIIGALALGFAAIRRRKAA